MACKQVLWVTSNLPHIMSKGIITGKLFNELGRYEQVSSSLSFFLKQKMEMNVSLIFKLSQRVPSTGTANERFPGAALNIWTSRLSFGLQNLPFSSREHLQIPCHVPAFRLCLPFISAYERQVQLVRLLLKSAPYQYDINIFVSMSVQFARAQSVFTYKAISQLSNSFVITMSASTMVKESQKKSHISRHVWWNC